MMEVVLVVADLLADVAPLGLGLDPELDDVAESDGKFAVTFWEMSHF